MATTRYDATTLLGNWVQPNTTDNMFWIFLNLFYAINKNTLWASVILLYAVVFGHICKNRIIVIQEYSICWPILKDFFVAYLKIVVTGGSIPLSTPFQTLTVYYDATNVSRTTTLLVIPQSCAAPHHSLRSLRWHCGNLIPTNQDQPLAYKQCLLVLTSV